MNNQTFILSGRYELLRPLGKGEAGSVYLAMQQSLEQYRAVKIFPKSSAQPLTALSEARILKTIQHPGIPTIYDFEEDECFYYLVEEYIQGDSLEEVLLHQQSISQNQFFTYCEQLCGIFTYLHTLRPAPILYQDLKPEHIIVCGSQLKIIDFSVASFASSSGNDFKHFGNAAFSAPELRRNQPVTRSSDLYSIGKILAYMSSYLSAADARSIFPIIQKATQADPSLRYETPQELCLAVQTAFEQGETTHLTQTIAVIGSHSGCGATHVAVSLVTALNHLGMRAVYQEKNFHNDLRRAIRQLPHTWEQNGCYYHHSFAGYPKYEQGVSIPPPDADVVVDDYGCDASSPNLATADILIYVCGGAPWRWDDAKAKDFLSHGWKDRLRLVANLCSRNTAIYFAKAFSAPVYPYPYDTEPFRANTAKTDFADWLLSLGKGRKRRLCFPFTDLISRLRQP